MTMIEPGGRRSVLKLLVGSVMAAGADARSCPACSRESLHARGQEGLSAAFRTLMRPIAPESTETLGTWLRQNGQTQGAINRFWRLVIASALNADMDEIALPYAVKVIRELFLNSAEAGAMGMSTVPLSELYAGAEQFLRERGGEVVFNAGVERAEWDEETSQWTLTTRAGAFVADYLVLAIPFEAMAKLLPQMPPAAGAEALARKIEHHEHWPICSVHLWFDREITDLEHAVLLDRTIHWMYNKSRLQPGRKGKGSYLELVDQRIASICRAQP